MLMNGDMKREQYSDELSEDKKGIVAWIKAHKKQLILAGISVTLLIAAVVVVKNKDAIKELMNSLKDEIEKADLYSSKWFEKATDAELDLEREKVRLEYCSPGDDFEAASRLQNLLWRFDKEMSKRAWGDEIPHGSSIHREHGWYLPNDD